MSSGTALEKQMSWATASETLVSSAAALEAQMSLAAALETRMSSPGKLEALMLLPAAPETRMLSPATLEERMLLPWRFRRRLAGCCSWHYCLNSVLGVHSFSFTLQEVFMLVLDSLVVLHSVAHDRRGLLSLLRERIIESKSMLTKSFCIIDDSFFFVACLKVPIFLIV